MADVITRFKLETTQYDSALRDASKGLSSYVKTVESAGKDFTKFSQEAVNAAKSLGQVASGATNTKDKLRDLVGAYNDVARTYNKLSEAQRQSDFGKNMAASLEQLQVRIRETKQELYSLGNSVKGGGGGLFGGGKLDGMLQVFGGNLMTKAFELASSAAMNFVNTIKDAAAQGIEMAKAGEGVRLAFERLNQPGLLDNLREATHGTVTDLELMKAAVKFNDFKLPVEELGTMLAFAQQKAKDTGQSVDYMVDSIVTGLGRKSLMILDNLGLSASEIKDRMAETGDMTKAVGEIIREQMEKAGEYTSTASDRATAAQVDLQNAMEEFGRTLLPLQEQGVSLWNEMEIGAIKFLNSGLREVIPGIIELKGDISELYDVAVNNPWTQGFLDWLETGLDISTRFLPYISEIRKILDAIKGTGDYQVNDSVGGLLQGAIRANTVTDIPEVVISGTSRPRATRTTAKTTPNPVEGSVDAQTKKVQDLQKAWRAAADDSSREEIKKQMDEEQYALDKLLGKVKDIPKLNAVDMKAIAPNGGIGSLIQDTFTRQQTGLTELKQKVKLELDTEALKTDENTLKTILQTVIQNGIDGMDLQLMGINDQIAKGINIPEETWQNLLDQINEKLAEMNIEPIKINFGTGNIDKEGKKFEKSWQAAASAVQSVGAAMNSIEDPAAKVAGTVMQAVASVALGYAQATTQAASLGPWAWIAFAASGLATMVSTIAAIHSSTGFADGGIVQGNTYSGDQIYAGLNAGEVVLNRAQTAGLAHELEGTGGGGNGGAVQAILSGEQAYIMINRYTKRSGKGELMTWK